MTRPPAPLPESLSTGAFPTTDATAGGLPRGRLRRRDLAVPTRGLRTPVGFDLDDVSLRARAFALVLARHQHLSHTTAVRLWGLAVPPWVAADRRLHVSTIGDGPVARRTGVVGHRVIDRWADVVVHDGLSTSSPVAAWCESAGLLAERDLVVIGDQLVARGMATSELLIARAEARRSRWSRRLRDAAVRVRSGSESPMETLVRLIVVDAGFPEPTLNEDVRDGRGRFLGRVDLGYPRLRIAIEYDGDHHRVDRATWQHDATRSNGFVAEGWLVLRVTSRDVSDPTAFLLRLSAAFRSRAA